MTTGRINQVTIVCDTSNKRACHPPNPLRGGSNVHWEEGPPRPHLDRSPRLSA